MSENWTDMVERLRPSYPDMERQDRGFKRQLREVAGLPPLTVAAIAKRAAA